MPVREPGSARAQPGEQGETGGRRKEGKTGGAQRAWGEGVLRPTLIGGPFGRSRRVDRRALGKVLVSVVSR